jgi:hypothetical protein
VILGVVVPVTITGTEPVTEVTGVTPELADVILPNTSTVNDP